MVRRGSRVPEPPVQHGYSVPLRPPCGQSGSAVVEARATWKRSSTTPPASDLPNDPKRSIPRSQVGKPARCLVVFRCPARPGKEEVGPHSRRMADDHHDVRVPVGAADDVQNRVCRCVVEARSIRTSASAQPPPYIALGGLLGPRARRAQHLVNAHAQLCSHLPAARRPCTPPCEFTFDVARSRMRSTGLRMTDEDEDAVFGSSGHTNDLARAVMVVSPPRRRCPMDRPRFTPAQHPPTCRLPEPTLEP